ncbi:MAG TPA: alkaline phosphatase family protein [Ignavibacteriaceae bacterium]|nr:alkaline phosphatase family protein [Ignavibacteriaceae bacterium]
MIKKFIILSISISLVILNLSGCSQKVKRPKLIVQLSIDGLKAGLLERYDKVFKYGFRKLLDEGLKFTNANVDHAVTVSQAGHVTIATGDHPAKHGIVDAAFYSTINNERVLVDCVQDSTEHILGYPKSKGVSPRQILASSIAGWVTDNDSKSKSLAVGTGYISSLLYSYKKNSDVYWNMGGKYLTSTYYKNKYPLWVQDFNDNILPKIKENPEVWANTVPEKYRGLSRPDTAFYEGDKIHTTFPHSINDELGDLLKKSPERAKSIWFGWTPTSDITTLKFAETGIDSMKLGQRNTTDYLAIILSQVDGNSHYYGPMSMEVFDILVRLDKAIGEFINYLDEKVGRDNYVLALTADHGFPEVVEYKQQQNKFARRLKKDEIENFFNTIEKSAKGLSDLSEERNNLIIKAAKKFDFIADVYSYSELSDKNNSTDKYLSLYQNSFRKDRVPRLPLFSLENFGTPIGKAGAMVRMEEGVMINVDVDTHGSVYDYDRKIPLIFYGSSIKPGINKNEAHIIDVSPTLAHIAGVPVPGDTDGKNIVDDNN